MANQYTVEDVQKSGTWTDVDPLIIREIPLPAAGERSRWQGIKHSDLFDALLKGFDHAGLKMTNETWTLSGFGERLFGYVSVSLDEDEFEETKKALSLPDSISYNDFAFEDIELRLGLRHSNDSTMALYFMVSPLVKGLSASITVDQGNISLRRRHTVATAKDVDTLQAAVNEGIKTFLVKAAQLDQEIKLLKSIKLTRVLAHHVMVSAAVQKIIPWAAIKKVDKCWGKGANAWDLYIAFTSAGSSYAIPREMKIVTKSRALILEMCNNEAAAIKEELQKESPAVEKQEAEVDVTTPSPQKIEAIKFLDSVF